MEFRRIFDTIPERFDKYRVRYCPELFAKFIALANITAESSVLELGPGTGPTPFSTRAATTTLSKSATTSARYFSASTAHEAIIP